MSEHNPPMSIDEPQAKFFALTAALQASLAPEAHSPTTIQEASNQLSDFLNGTDTQTLVLSGFATHVAYRLNKESADRWTSTTIRTDSKGRTRTIELKLGRYVVCGAHEDAAAVRPASAEEDTRRIYVPFARLYAASPEEAAALG